LKRPMLFIVVLFLLHPSPPPPQLSQLVENKKSRI
jgi:hypothetical protein